MTFNKIDYHECGPLGEGHTIFLKHGIEENIGYSYISFEAENYSNNRYLPITVSVTSCSYSSCLKFTLKEIGTDSAFGIVAETGEPMSLSRF